MKSISTRLRRVKAAFLFLFFILIAFIGCKKEPYQPGPAKGFFVKSEYGICLPNTKHGIWYNGFPADADTNYVDINIDVSSPGSYSITTDRINGVTFTASGNFTDTGLNMVRMRGTGSFIKATESVFPITFDSSFCEFDVDILDSAGLSIADNSWHFTAGDHTFGGTVKANWYSLPSDLGYSFELEGSSQPSSPDTVLYISFIAGNPGDTGTYLTSKGASFSFRGGSQVFFGAGYNTLPAVVDIHFISFTGIQSPISKGYQLFTFDGTAIDAAKKIVPITNSRIKWSGAN